MSGNVKIDDEEKGASGSDTEEAVLCRNGVSPNDVFLERKFNISITKRCEMRVEWANTTLGSDKDSIWVCDLKHQCASGSKTCHLYRELHATKEELVEAEKELVEAKQKVVETEEKLAHPKQNLDKAILELTKAEEKLANATRKLSQAQNESHQQHGSEGGTALLSNIVDLRKEAVDRERIIVGQEELLVDQEKLLVDVKRKAVDEKRKAVDLRKGALRDHCEKLYDRHSLKKESLLQAKDAGNKTDYMTPRTGAKTLNEEVKEANNDVAGAPKVESPSALMQKLQKGSAKVLQDNVSLATRFPAKYPTLEKFYKFCNKMLKRSKPCPHKYASKDFVECIRGTVRCITSWTPKTRLTKSYFRPSAVAQETMAVQPILFAIIWKISAILGCGAHLTKEQFLPPQENKSKRWMDAMMSPIAKQHLLAALGNLMGCAIEIKPLSREGASYEKIVAKGADQVLGHEGQLLWDSCFQFCGGLGRDGRTSGMVLTMASVQIMEAEVKNVGTEEVDFDLRDNGNLPLFSKKTTEILFGEYKDKKKRWGYSNILNLPTGSL